MLCFLSHSMLLVGSRVDIDSPARVLLSFAKKVQQKKKNYSKRGPRCAEIEGFLTHMGHMAQVQRRTPLVGGGLCSLICVHTTIFHLSSI